MHMCNHFWPKLFHALARSAISVGLWGAICGRLNAQDVSIPHLRLDQPPIVAMPDRITPTPKEHEEIEDLIDQLAEIDTRTYGVMYPLPFERVFLPVGCFRSTGELVSAATIDGVGATPLVRLVHFGPRAMPQLLAALGDRRATKLIARAMTEDQQNDRMMWFDNILKGNELNRKEQRVLDLGRSRYPGHNMPAAEIAAYRFKVGDVCFVALGQIVGRPYYAASTDHPKSRDLVICTPVHNQHIHSMVRDIWLESDCTKQLFTSLLLDYCTRGVFDGVSLDTWDDGNAIQLAAATRLLYYFPKEGGDLVSKRLDLMDVSRDKDFIDQCVANGVRADDFVEAVAWSESASVREALKRLVGRVSDRNVIQALERAGIHSSQGDR